MKDDVTELIVNALTGVCVKCKGRGYTFATPLAPKRFGAPPVFDMSTEYDITICEACNGTGVA